MISNELMEFDKSAYPDYKMSIAPATENVRAICGELVLAESQRTMKLEETGLPDVYYFPADDVQMSKLKSNEHSTHCPLKGDASYWDLDPEGDNGTNIAWSYQNPINDAAAIAGYIAFYTDRVTVSAS